MKRTIPNIEALKLIEESIKAGDNVLLTVRGSSMRPRLVDGVDIVTLQPFINEDIKIGEVILFRYRGAFLLHRVVDIQGDNVTDRKIFTKGDALMQREEISYCDVIAVASVPKIGVIKLALRRGRFFLSRLFFYFSKLLVSHK